MKLAAPRSDDGAEVIFRIGGVWRCSASVVRANTHVSAIAPRVNNHVLRRFIDPILQGYFARAGRAASVAAATQNRTDVVGRASCERDVGPPVAVRVVTVHGAHGGA